MNAPLPKRLNLILNLNLILILVGLAVVFLASVAMLSHGAHALHIAVGPPDTRRTLAWLLDSLPWAVACAAAFCWSRIITNISSRKTQLALTGGLALITSLWLTFQPLIYSFDVLRYLWDGRLMMHGVSPYRYVPDDPHLTALRHWAYWHPMAWKHWPEAYPPFAQAYFWLAAWITNGTVTGYKLLVFVNGWVANGLFLHLLVVRRRTTDKRSRYLAVLTDRDLQSLALWLLLPPVLIETFGSGHVDAFTIPWLLWAWIAALRKRPVQLGIAIGLATAIRLFPIVLFAALWHRKDRWSIATSLAACILTIAVVGVPLMGDPHGLTAYYQHMLAYNGSIDYVLAKWFGSAVIAHATLIVAVLETAAWGLVWFTPARHLPIEHKASLLGLTFVLASPLVHPWYLLSVLPFAVMAFDWAVLWLAFAAHFTYDDLLGDMWIEYIPTYGFYVWKWIKALRG